MKNVIIGTVFGLFLSLSAIVWFPIQVTQVTGIAPVPAASLVAMLDYIEELQAQVHSYNSGKRGI